MKLHYFIIILLIILIISIPIFTYKNSCDKCIITYNEKHASGRNSTYKLAINDIYNEYKLGNCLIRFDKSGYKFSNMGYLK